MDIRRPNILTLCTLVVALLAASSPCLAQGRPTPPTVAETSATTITPENATRMKTWVKYWASQLQNPSAVPEEVETARAELVRPLNNPGVSGIYRLDYSKLVVPELESVAGGTNLHAAVNSMLIASMLGTERAATFLLGHVDSRDEKRWQIRLQAAFGATNLLRGEWLDVRRMKNAANILREAAQREENPLVLRHVFTALDSIDHAPLSPADQREVRMLRLEAVTSVIDRVAAKPPDGLQPLLEVINAAILQIREKFITNAVTPDERQAISAKLGPRLGQLLVIGKNQWDAAQANASHKASFAEMVGAWEGFLASMETIVRNKTVPETMRKAWVAGDKGLYETQLATWETTLKQPPYEER